MKLLFKIIAFLSGCLIICVITIASNSQWSDALSLHIPSPYRYGDLFLFSSVPGYRIPLNSEKIQSPFKSQCKATSLTVVGDSYMFGLDSTCVCAESFHFIRWGEIPDTILPLAHKKKNILIVETSERHCRWILKNNTLFFISENKSIKAKTAEIKLGAEDNLQYILTNLDWVIPLKELKTFIWLNCFDKVDGRVAKPDGKGRLFLEETINPENYSSCYNPVSDNEINEIVCSINMIYEKARKIGFDEVYISIIPNAASLYYSCDLPYNNIIERIQENTNLKVPCIDAFHLLKKQKESVFYVNDSHWNIFGKKVWLTAVDSILRKEN